MGSQVIRISAAAYQILKIEALAQKRTMIAQLDVILTLLASWPTPQRDGWSPPVDLTGAHVMIDGVDHTIGPPLIVPPRNLTYEEDK